MTEAPFDVQQAHRWFAIEFNNLAWDLVELPARSVDEVDRMIHAAHAACLHWLQAGNLLNHLRAQCLLATAYAKAGRGEFAVEHAQKCLSLSQQAGDQQTAFDWATAHGCAANAYACAGKMTEARSHHQRALAAAEPLDADEQRVFSQLYPAP